LIGQQQGGPRARLKVKWEKYTLASDTTRAAFFLKLHEKCRAVRFGFFGAVITEYSA